MQSLVFTEGSTDLGDLVLGTSLNVSGFVTEVKDHLAAVLLVTEECIPVAELAEFTGEPSLTQARLDAILYANIEAGVNSASLQLSQRQGRTDKS